MKKPGFRLVHRKQFTRIQLICPAKHIYALRRISAALLLIFHCILHSLFKSPRVRVQLHADLQAAFPFVQLNIFLLRKAACHKLPLQPVDQIIQISIAVYGICTALIPTIQIINQLILGNSVRIGQKKHLKKTNRL